MAKQSLAVKYRPKSFEDLTEQDAIKEILTDQINTKTFQHAYLLTGPAGTGKTTTARIFASMINDNKGNPIEVDAASNSGVDNIRNIIDDSKRKPLDADYKIFIIDECHSLSNGAWQAMLKLLEEPPKFSIFILCTTDPQKIPATIMSRVQRFQFNKLSNKGVVERLNKICVYENSQDINDPDLTDIGDIVRSNDAIEFIAKVAEGGMRDAITMLDKCLSLSHDITLENVLRTIGTEDYDSFFKLLSLLCNKDKSCVLCIEEVYNSGKDVKLFLKEFGKFILDIEKYIVFNKNTDHISIPSTTENIENMNKFLEFSDDVFDIMEMIVSLNSNIKWDSDPKTIVELTFLLYCKGD